MPAIWRTAASTVPVSLPVVSGLQVDVAGRAAFPKCGQQHAALEHEPLGEGCLGQPGEEALQDVKLDQLIDRAPILPGLPAQIEIGLSGDGGARRCRHNSTAKPGAARARHEGTAGPVQ